MENGEAAMFKTLLPSTCAVTIGLWLTGMAQAAPMTFTDMWDVGPVYLHAISGPTSYTFEHDITDSGYSPGSITTAKITIEFDEDYVPASPDPTDYPILEWAQVVIGATSYGPWEIDHNDEFVLTLMPDALAALSSTGKVSVTALAIKKGDFRFIDSKPVAKGLSASTPPPQATPEPSTLILLGSGLAGVASFGLRRRKQEELS
jgi:PEP-CTERM motif